MKKLINSFILWLIDKFGVTFPSKEGGKKSLCKIKIDDRFIQLTMPNGEIIPCQTDTTIGNSVLESGYARVSITVFVNLSDITL